MFWALSIVLVALADAVLALRAERTVLAELDEQCSVARAPALPLYLDLARGHVHCRTEPNNLPLSLSPTAQETRPSRCLLTIASLRQPNVLR